jgi:adenine/guanine phosphoribosyltransferase-like PRPP-binding protein
MMIMMMHEAIDVYKNNNPKWLAYVCSSSVLNKTEIYKHVVNAFTDLINDDDGDDDVRSYL